MTEHEDIEAFTKRARDWLLDNAEPRADNTDPAPAWGEGSDDVAVFHDLTDAQEADLLERAMAWQRRKFDAGFGALTWPESHGGAGLPAAYERAFAAEEAAFVTPAHHETFSVTLRLVAPTVAAFGTPDQQRRFVPRFLRTSELCCQLFSEPGAGSDLAAVQTRAVRDGDDWVLTGQKVWSSGARFAAWGEAICRTDPSVPKHKGQTAFLVPMDSPGVKVVPIRQMSGGASFNEVFLDEVRVPDSLRLGGVGEGWKVALTTLGFERGASGTAEDVGGSWDRVRALATWLGATGDPVVRQALAGLYALDRVRHAHTLRTTALAAARPDGGPPGPEGSIGKLLWTIWLSRVSDVVSTLLGPRLAADTGEWGTYAWAQHVLGAPGYRIAGGSDEVQRNIIGERVLGLPGEPRVDRDLPFSEVPR